MARLALAMMFLIYAPACVGALSDPTEPSRETEIAFASNDVVLRGTLFLPSGRGPHPVVVVAHGASGGLRTFPLYRALVEDMNEIGVAVFVYDRRGAGASEGSPGGSSFEILAADLVNAVDMLRARPDISPTSVGLWGHSQGGWIAPLAYAAAPDRVAFLVIVSGSGVTPSQQMQYAAETQVRAAGYGQAAALRARHIRRLRDEFFKGRAPRAVVQAEIDAVSGEPWFDLLYIRPLLPEEPATERWFQEMDASSIGHLCSIRAPVALFFGAADAWVPAEESAAAWRDCLAASGSEHQIHIIQDTGHTMIVNEPANHTSGSQGVFSPEYRARLREFVRARHPVGRQ